MASPSSDSIRVLHVDDEPDFAEMAGEFISRHDERLEVTTVTGASDALDRLQEEWHDCIVSDYDMPGKNGIEFLEAVRDDYPDLPFILYTGKGSEEVASEAISAGVSEYLQKESGTSQYEVLANRIVNLVEKRQAQLDLRDREERLNLFFEQSPLGVIRWDENFDFARMNQQATDILGYDEADLDGCSWEAIVPESDQDDVQEVVSELLANKGGYHSINQNVRKDGERIICEWHNRVVTNQNDEVVAIYSQFQDITERRQRERRYEAIFNNSHTFVGLMEPDGTLIEANETALSFGDLDRAAVVGEPIWQTYWFQENDEAQTAAKQAVEQARTGELFHDEVRVRGSNRKVVIDFTVRPIFDEQGEVRLLVPEGRDITQLKARQQELQETKSELEAAIAETDEQNQALEDFLDIVNDATRSFDEKMTEVLELGVEFLDLDIGILSQIEPPDYTVKYVTTPDDSIDQGEVLDFTNTYCSLVYEADGPVAFHSPSDGGVKDHPAYQELGLEAYLGEPLVVDSDRYGTLNFSSPTSRDEPFSDGEKAFIRTVAEWTSTELRRHNRERELTGIVENAPVGLFRLDDQLRIVYENQRAEEIVGVPEGEDESAALGRDIRDLPSVQGTGVVEAFDRLGTGETVSFDTAFESIFGKQSYLTGKGVPLFENGTFDGAIIMVVDITERRETKRILEQLKQNITDVVWMTTPGKDSMDFISDSYEDVWGRSTESLRENPLSFVDAIHPEDHDRVRDALEDQQQNPDAYEETYRIMQPDGELRWVYDRSSGVYEDGELTRIIGIASDITERKERERELREMKRRLDIALEGTETGIWAWKIGTDEVEWNETLERVVGLEPGTFEGTYEAFAERVHPDDLPQVEERIELAIETGEQYHAEFRMIHVDGGILWAEVQGIIDEKADEPDRMIGLHRDITERKAREAELRRQNERLEEFASIVSHDLRNPLNVAEGQLELAREERDSENLDALARAHERMETLIDDLLTLARDGEAVGDTELIDLVDLTENCWRNVDTADATLTSDIDRRIHADLGRLQQLLENLMRNAVEHGGEDVTITIGEMEDGFYVEDDGPGIPEDEQDDVFDAGYSTTEKGTGFGLSIVEQVAQAHGWDVRVTDGSEGGARFEITGMELAA